MADVVLVAAGAVVGVGLMLFWRAVYAVGSSSEGRYEAFMKRETAITGWHANDLPLVVKAGVLVGVLLGKLAVPAMVVALMWLVWR